MRINFELDERLALFLVCTVAVISVIGIATGAPQDLGHSPTEIGQGTFYGDSNSIWSFPGSVGIATTTPTQKLHVAGSINISGTGSRLHFPDGTSLGSNPVNTNMTTYNGQADYTVAIPFDNTIPQSSEGTEITQLSTTITPKSASSILQVEAVVYLGAGNRFATVALFRDSGTDAVASAWDYVDTNHMTPMHVTYKVVAGSTNPTTFKVRCGGHDTQAVQLNGAWSYKTRGGGTIYSFVKVTEIPA